METENKTEELKKTLKSYNKKYYDTHKEKILTNIKEKKLCPDCSKMYSISNFSKHKRYGNCILIDERTKKEQLKRKKLIELNDYITKMNEKYDTDVKLFEIPN